MSLGLPMKIAEVVSQSKQIDANIEQLVVRLANERATSMARSPRQYAQDDEEQDALVGLALTTVRQILDEHRLIITMLQQLMYELAPDRLWSP